MGSEGPSNKSCQLAYFKHLISLRIDRFSPKKKHFGRKHRAPRPGHLNLRHLDPFKSL